MILSDSEITENINSGVIGWTPFEKALVQPASIDMRLDRYWRYYPEMDAIIDPAAPKRYTRAIEEGSYTLEPQAFVLASTVEQVRFPAHLVGRLEGKSSLARMGIFIHVTAGFIDPGFEGYVTLEIFNANPNPVTLRAGMPVAQMSFSRLGRTAARAYGQDGLNSKYQNQERGPRESAYYKNFAEGG